MGRSKKNKLLEDDEDTRCGLGPFHGKWLQRFATKKSYLLTYSFLGLFQAMFFSYSIATLTTLEKQFKLKSQTTGILLSGNEVSQILLSLVMTYFGGDGHRPRLAAFGILFSGVASLLIVVPHFAYGQYSPTTNVTRSLDVCSTSPESVLPTIDPNEECTVNQAIGPMIYIFMSQFVSGIGTTLFSILGITYLDDNVKRKQTPMLIGLMSSLRLVGPALGYALAAICIRMYVNLTETTTLKPRDPSWIGAWWLGFMIIGIIQLSTAWMLACYPRVLPKKPTLSRGISTASNQTTRTNKPKQRTLKQFPAALRRLFTNRILILNNLAGVFFVFALSGYITFLPKYMETQFQQSAARSGLVNGMISILFMCTGLLLAGYLISKFQPKAWKLQIFDVVIGLLWIITLIIFAFVSCDSKPIYGLHNAENGEDVMLGIPATPCNEDCNCQANRFAPACSEDGQINFFSACHAGCTGQLNHTDRSDQTIFTDCSCIKEWVNSTDYSNSTTGAWINGRAIGGYCPSNCFQMFIIYVLAMGIVKFLSSFGRVSNIIITFRCVPPEDKSFAIGLGYLLTSLFAFIPAPIVYGAVIDKACILWRTDACGERGNCWIYDQEKMRMYLHLLTAGVVVIAVVIDFFVCFAVRDLDLYAEEPEEDLNGELVSSANGKELQPMLSSRPPVTNNLNGVYMNTLGS